MLKNCKSAIILAGGKSTRMGFDKINIPYKGGRLIDYQIKELKKIFSEIIIVSSHLPDENDKMVKFVTDELHQIGPLAGLHVGLKHASSPYVYVIACDMPYINQEFIKVMDEALIHFDKDVLLSQVNGYMEPFNAIYRQSLFKKIEDFISNNEIYKLNEFIKKTNYQMIDESIVQSFDVKMFYNLNTLQDIKKYLKD